MEDWVIELQGGRPEAAWDRLLERYRRLIFAAIRHYAQDYDEVMDVFARVCEVLREDDLARLRCYVEQPIHSARFSTWLVTVVRHLTIDWFRHRHGRRRLSALAERLPALRRRIFELVFFERRSSVEAYELLRAREAPDLPFGRFLSELRETHKAATAGRRGRVLRELGPPPAPEPQRGGRPSGRRGRSPPRPPKSQGSLQPGTPGTRHAAAKLGADRHSLRRLVATLPPRSV
ncbi:MAG: hypothetical protein DMD52_08860 [Gemmatimonadetes bacterium]|nr:MAG: hypothetical protein DMD52_08860 [Gemmatimonadota bacterium]